MSAPWSAWVMFLIVLNLGITLFLFLYGLRVHIPTLSDGTTGHVWAHGVLREGVRRLPTWWVLFSASMFVAGFIYLALYPGFGRFEGLLGWTSNAELERDQQSNAMRMDPLLDRIRIQPIEALARDEGVTSMGHTLFQDNCAACHGREGHGNTAIGAPNLVDQDWLYGGDAEALLTSILDGRSGVMPALGGALGKAGVNEVTAYVLSLSGYHAPEDWIAAGEERFGTVCAACHGVDARGNPLLGAPNLTDEVWLYGGDFASIAATVNDGRSGVMPAWRERLAEEQVRAIAAWVYAKSHPQTQTE